MKNKKDLFIIPLLTILLALTIYNTIRVNSLTNRLKSIPDVIEKDFTGGQVYLVPTTN